jgi:hypothetical protein
MKEGIKKSKASLGNCYTNSFVIWQKLYNINSKRVRGLITSDDIPMFHDGKMYTISELKKIDEKCCLHYWVEANDMVYDINNLQSKILSKNAYYKLFQISEVEYADGGIFYNNYKTIAGKDDIDELITHILPSFKFKRV